jgi:hypothetical protein
MRAIEEAQPMDDDGVPGLNLPGLDFNADGQITVTDVGQWIMQVLLLPGDLALSLLMQHLAFVASFFELDKSDFGGTVSITLSILFWIIVLIMIGLGLNAIRNFDRWLTSWSLGRIREGRRICRVVRRKFTSWVGQLRQRRLAQVDEVEVGEVDLEAFDAAVLRCYGSAGEMRVLAIDEVARSLQASLQRVKAALRRLGDYHLVEPAFGTSNGRNAHQITRAGQIYLIER